MKNSFDIHTETSSNKRQAFRVAVDDLVVRVHGHSDGYPAIDISPTGIGLGNNPAVEIGDLETLSLYRKGIVIAEKIAVRVVRIEESVTGFQFDALDRRQSNAIHAIVLDAQKREARRRQLHKAHLQ